MDINISSTRCRLFLIFSPRIVGDRARQRQQARKPPCQEVLDQATKHHRLVLRGQLELVVSYNLYSGDYAETFHSSRFSVLEVEDTNEFYEPAPSDVAVQSLNAPLKTADENFVDVYKLALDKHLEDSFATFCFLEDLNHARQQLQQVWTEYNDGNISLLVAAVVTEAAMIMIQRAENEITAIILSAAQSPKEVNDMYSAMLAQLQVAQHLKTRTGLEHVEDPEKVCPSRPVKQHAAPRHTNVCCSSPDLNLIQRQPGSNCRRCPRSTENP